MSMSRIARDLLASYDQVKPVAPGTVPAELTMVQAREIQAEIIAARQQRGEKPVGYKIGFTNRTIWPLYGVHHPIWAPIYDTTLTLLAEGGAGHIVPARFTEPRLEPEIVVCLSTTPADNSVEAISRSVDWIAHGFEIVQSVYPQWQFTGAQSMAAQALHGALVVGPQFGRPDFASEKSLADQLSHLSLKLYLNDQPEAVDQGVGSNVLDGPIQALAYLANELAAAGRQLRAGDIITTGTLTDAQPLLPGQRWRTELADAGPLQNLTLVTDA